MSLGYGPKMERYRDEHAGYQIPPPMATIARESSPLIGELAQMEKNLHALTAVVDLLIARLDAVTIGAAVSHSNGVPEHNTQRPMSSVASQLVTFNVFLQVQTQRLQTLQESIDL